MRIIIMLITIGSSLFSYEYLNISLGACEQALANSLLPSAFSKISFANPLGIQGSAVGVSYLSYLAGTHYGGIGYNEDRKIYKLGFFANYFNSGNIPKIDEEGRSFGTFSLSYLTLKPLFALNFLPHLTIGGAGLFIYSTVDTFLSLGLGFDLMGMVEASIFRLGLGLKNFGYITKPYIKTKPKLPYTLCSEVSVYLLDKKEVDIVSYAGVSLPKEDRTNVNFGGEFKVMESLILRLGFTTRKSDLKTEAGGDILVGTSFGLGVTRYPISVNYAFLPHFVLGNAHIFNLFFSLPK